MEILTAAGEHYDLPEDYSLDLELINPVLDQVGSQTAPGTLPFTPRNLRLLDYPNRIDRAKKYTIKRNVTLRQGLFMKNATQAVLKANPSDKIVTTFYFDEAIFYEKIKSQKLNTLDFTVDPAFPTASAPSVQTCKNLIFQVMRQDRESDFHVFPVLTKLEKYPAIFDILTNPEILNATIHTGTTLTQLRDWSGRTETIDNTEITYPPGYGITPFLKISYLIESIAKAAGYTVGENTFKTHPELQHLVILNNVADAICRGHIDYRQLVPDIPVSDFVETLKKKFGAVFIIEEQKNLIHIRLLEEILSSAPDADLTAFLTATPKIEWSEPKQVKLSAGTSLPFSQPETALYEEFVKIHGEPLPFGFYQEINKPYFVAPEASYIMYVPDKEKPGYNKIIRISSSNFQYFTNDKIETEEMTSPDEQVAELSFVENVGKNPNNTNILESYVLPVIGEKTNKNTTIYINNEAQEAGESSMPLIFCFRVPGTTADEQKRKTIGTPYRNINADATWGNLTLTYQGEFGLYNTFWKKYDTCLRSSFHTVQCTLKMPWDKLQSLKLHTPKLLFNQPVLIERIKCRIGNGKCEITEATFRTLRAYEE